MKGIVLAGGLGKRLYPLTKVTNKHLLPVGRQPMIYYPLETLAKGGIKEILLVTGGQYRENFENLLEDGKQFGFKSIFYAVQSKEAGIADALKLAEDFAKEEPIVVILGDNIFESNIQPWINSFNNKGACVFLKEVSEPQHYGVADLQDGKIIQIIEKPQDPVSPYAVTGLYLYDSQVYDFIRQIKPSHRGELEITDVNQIYLEKGLLRHEFIKEEWYEAGTFEGYLRANFYKSAVQDRNSLAKEIIHTMVNKDSQ
jgi:glucose-1-phosphate thymidylyltransferase